MRMITRRIGLLRRSVTQLHRRFSGRANAD
jgi:hypothetical protein